MEVKKKVDPIVLTDKETEKKYTLDFCRESVVFAEKQGFNIGKIESGEVLSTLYDLWFYAFRMHHRFVQREQADSLLDKLLQGGGKKLSKAVLVRLCELYKQPYEALDYQDGDEDDGDEGNAQVAVEL